MCKSPVPALSPFIKLFDGGSASSSVNTILRKENIISGLIFCGQKAKTRWQNKSVIQLIPKRDEALVNEETITRENRQG